MESRWSRDRGARAGHHRGMHRSILGLLTLLMPLAVACEPVESPPPSIENMSVEDAAELTTEIACDYVDRCGLIEVSCADCAEGQDCGGCFVERREVDVDTCAADLRPDLEAGFGCETLTPEEEALVDECLSLLPTAECTSIEEVEAWANGGEGSDPREGLSACDQVEEIRYRCSDVQSPTPVPG